MRECMQVSTRVLPPCPCSLACHPSSDGGASFERSGSSSDEDYQDYVDMIGGGGEGDAEAEAIAGERALAFFLCAGGAGVAAAEGRGADEGEGLLFRAYQVASDISSHTQSAARRRQRERDALSLLEKLEDEVQDGLCSDDAARLEARLRVCVCAWE